MAVVYGIGQVVESLFLTPRLVGERIGLHPLAVIFALLAFGQLFGFVGVLIALPVSAVLLVAVRRAARRLPRAAALYQRMKQIAAGHRPSARAPSSFDSFCAGRERRRRWRTCSRGPAPPRSPVPYLWGAGGSGKTHLLRALVAQRCTSRAQRSRLVRRAADSLPWEFDEAWALVVLDDCDALDAAQQHAAFALFVDAPTLRRAGAGRRARAAGRPAAARGPAHPPRLGPCVRAAAAERGRGAAPCCAARPTARGIFLCDEVMDYLLTRFARDLKHLMALLDQLDDYALRQQARHHRAAAQADARRGRVRERR